jgi:hypothetical protein
MDTGQGERGGGGMDTGPDEGDKESSVSHSEKRFGGERMEGKGMESKYGGASCI